MILLAGLYRAWQLVRCMRIKVSWRTIWLAAAINRCGSVSSGGGGGGDQRPIVVAVSHRQSPTRKHRKRLHRAVLSIPWTFTEFYFFSPLPFIFFSVALWGGAGSGVDSNQPQAALFHIFIFLFFSFGSLSSRIFWSAVVAVACRRLLTITRTILIFLFASGGTLRSRLHFSFFCPFLVIGWEQTWRALSFLICVGIFNYELKYEFFFQMDVTVHQPIFSELHFLRTTLYVI